jgi:hypothetical protein
VKKGKDPVFSRNPLTPEQAATLADSLTRALDGEESDIANLLLLCHALTFEPDLTAREGMLMAIEREAGPLLTAVDDALRNVKRRQFEALIGGAGK